MLLRSSPALLLALQIITLWPAWNIAPSAVSHVDFLMSYTRLEAFLKSVIIMLSTEAYWLPARVIAEWVALGILREHI